MQFICVSFCFLYHISFMTINIGVLQIHGSIHECLQIVAGAQWDEACGMQCDELVYNTLMDGCVKANAPRMPRGGGAAPSRCTGAHLLDLKGSSIRRPRSENTKCVIFNYLRLIPPIGFTRIYPSGILSIFCWTRDSAPL